MKINYSILCILATLFLTVNINANTDDNPLDTSIILRNASEHIAGNCANEVKKWLRITKEWGEYDSLFAESHGLRLLDFGFFNINEDQFAAALVGCCGNGEFILMDSANLTNVVNRINVNIPGYHANFGGLIDANKDGVKEMIIYLSAGAHGMYLYLLSIERDSIRFITNRYRDKDVYEFYGSSSVDIRDSDGDGYYEIEAVDRESATIDKIDTYTWDGAKFKITKTRVKDYKQEK